VLSVLPLVVLGVFALGALVLFITRRGRA